MCLWPFFIKKSSFGTTFRTYWSSEVSFYYVFMTLSHEKTSFYDVFMHIGLQKCHFTMCLWHFGLAKLHFTTSLWQIGILTCHLTMCLWHFSSKCSRLARRFCQQWSLCTCFWGSLFKKHVFFFSGGTARNRPEGQPPMTNPYHIWVRTLLC